MPFAWAPVSSNPQMHRTVSATSERVFTSRSRFFRLFVSSGYTTGETSWLTIESEGISKLLKDEIGPYQLRQVLTTDEPLPTRYYLDVTSRYMKSRIDYMAQQSPDEKIPLDLPYTFLSALNIDHTAFVVGTFEYMPKSQTSSAYGGIPRSCTRLSMFPLPVVHMDCLYIPDPTRTVPQNMQGAHRMCSNRFGTGKGLARFGLLVGMRSL